MGSLLALRAVFALTGGPDAWVTQLPDDAFYYFVLAKNFAATGQWSFDGVAPASGFHPLWAYALAGIHHLVPDIDLPGLALFSAVTGILCFASAAWLTIDLLTEHYGGAAAGAVASVLLGGVALWLPTLGLEVPFVVLFGAVAARLALSERGAPHPGALALAGLTGAAGVLARSDWIVMPAALLGAALLPQLGRGAERTQSLHALRRCSALALGAALGSAVVVAQSWLLSGEPLQGSVRVKLHWSALTDTSWSSVLKVADVFFYNALLPRIDRGLVCMAILAGLAWWAVRRHRLAAAPPAAGTLAVLLYLLLYSRNAEGLQVWYHASFFVPAMLLFGPAFAPLSRPGRPWQKAIAAALVALAVAGGVVGSWSLAWPHQRAMREAGVFLAAHPEIAPVGSFNAGAIAWFARRPVVNLDGLVNDDVHAYVAEGRLVEYLREREIRYLVDFSIMLGSEAIARRSGDPEQRLARCARPLRRFGRTARERWMRSRLVLYRLDARCLAGGPRPGPLDSTGRLRNAPDRVALRGGLPCQSTTVGSGTCRPTMEAKATRPPRS